jgi:hypothetical protein
MPPAGKYPFSNGVYHSCGWGEFLENEPVYETCMAVGNPVSTVESWRPIRKIKPVTHLRLSKYLIFNVKPVKQFHKFTLRPSRSCEPWIDASLKMFILQMNGFQHFDSLAGALLVLIQYTVPDSAYDPLHAALRR